MTAYNNRTGTVTAIEDDGLYVDSELVLTDMPRSKELMKRARPSVGDRVEFNFNEKTGELIYLRVVRCNTPSRIDDDDRRSFLPPSRGEMASMDTPDALGNTLDHLCELGSMGCFDD